MRIEKIEIVVNGTEIVRQDWSSHRIEVPAAELFVAMNVACLELGWTLADLGSSEEGPAEGDRELAETEDDGS